MPTPKRVADNKPAPKPPASKPAPRPAPKTAPQPESKPAPKPPPVKPPPVQAPDNKPAPAPDNKPAPARPDNKPAPSAPDNKPAQTTPAAKFVSTPAPVVAVIASAYDADQIANQKTVVSLCENNHVPMLGTLAALCAGAGENTWHSDGCNSSNHCGFWQLDSTWQAMHDYHDVEYWTRYAIQHGFYGQGGLSKIAKDHPTWRPGDVAQACQGAGPSPTWPNPADYYQSKLGEAEAVYNRYKSSASVPGVPVIATSTLYANPLQDARVTAGRIDQGVDYAGTGHLSAIAAGKIANYVIGGWGSSGNVLQYEITQKGPLEGVLIYYNEGIVSKRQPGDTFKAGEWVAELAQVGSLSIEIGFASGQPSLETWARVYGGGYNEGDLTRAGIAMNNLIIRLGGPGGTTGGRTAVGEFPPWAPGGHVPNNVSPVAAGIGGGSGGNAVAFTAPGSARKGSASYDWPVQNLSAWTALDKGADDAGQIADDLRAYVNPIKYITTKGAHN